MIIAIEFLGICLISLLFSSLFFYGFRRRGPWSSFWSFILIVFLGVFLFDIWIEPVGPMYWGVAWIDLFFIGGLFALLLAASTPSEDKYIPFDEAPTPNEEGKLTPPKQKNFQLGTFFWVLIVLFMVTISIGIVA